MIGAEEMTEKEFVEKHCCHDSHAEFCDENCDKCEKEFREDLEELKKFILKTSQ